MFRVCEAENIEQWREGCRMPGYEHEENCRLWQKITSESIPERDINYVIYRAELSALGDTAGDALKGNKFAEWLYQPEHADDLEYVRIAKEIEQIRGYLTNPWYYGYDGDEEHERLGELMDKCRSYAGKRHATRYTLQMVRLHFATGEYNRCIELWENRVSKMPQDIIRDMIGSYVGGAYLRSGDRDRAIELYVQSGDIGSLMQAKVWDGVEKNSEYTDERVKKMEYIFNRFPDSPLLTIKLQRHIRGREWFECNYDKSDSNRVYDNEFYDEMNYTADEEQIFHEELKRFAKRVVRSKECKQKGMWNYALGYMAYLDGNINEAYKYAKRAEQSNNTPYIDESIRAFKMLVEASRADNSAGYRSRLLADLRWLDGLWERDLDTLHEADYWQFDHKHNRRYYYWADVARRVLLGEACPRLIESGNPTLALHLANYASNRGYQLVDSIEVLREFDYYNGDNGYRWEKMSIDKYRNDKSSENYLDYSNQFFEMIVERSADEAARYVGQTIKSTSKLVKFLNERSYIDRDYLYDIVGTMYLREMKYDKAVEWLGKVSADYQQRTNLREYFRLDPFKYQCDAKRPIDNSDDYKMRFAQEMAQLERMIDSDCEPNRKANAKIRYAIGLRNSFGRCWYLTRYGYDTQYTVSDDYSEWAAYHSTAREGFTDDKYAQLAYTRVDQLIDEGLGEFTDPEQAASAQLEMMNFNTVVEQYAASEAAKYVRRRCDRYYDYALGRM